MTTKSRALIIAALLAPLAVFAEPPPPPEAGPGAAFGEHGQAHMQQRMEELHKELKLTDAQEPAWENWIEKVKAARQEKKEARPDLAALQSMNAIQRMEKMIEFGKAREASMTEVLNATRPFYATLNPAQKKTFDDMAPFGARGPKWGPGGHHGRGMR